MIANAKVVTLGMNKGSKRVWLQGKAATKAGFTIGASFGVFVSEDRLILSRATTGARRVGTVSKKGQTPIIDINNNTDLAAFDGMAKVKVTFLDGQIVIEALATELRRIEREDTLRDMLDAGDPIPMASVCHGIGVMSAAIHDGLTAAGITSKLVWANEIREELIEQAASANHAWDDDTIGLAMPLQELAADQRLLQQLPRPLIIEAGLACSGASTAGRAVRHTECAEAHPFVGALMVPFLQLIREFNPCIALIENVVPYSSTGSAWQFRNIMADMGYTVHEKRVTGDQWNCIEDRERIILIAVSKGIEFDIEALLAPEHKDTAISDILEHFEHDDPIWKSYDYLKDHCEKHAKKGNGFALQLRDSSEPHFGCVTKGYAKIRASDVKIRHPLNPSLMRQITASEHCSAKRVPHHLIAGLSNTIAHEALGQSVLYPIFHDLGKTIGNALAAILSHQVAPATQVAAVSSAANDDFADLPLFAACGL